MYRGSDFHAPDEQPRKEDFRERTFSIATQGFYYFTLHYTLQSVTPVFCASTSKKLLNIENALHYSYFVWEKIRTNTTDSPLSVVPSVWDRGPTSWWSLRAPLGARFPHPAWFPSRIIIGGGNSVSKWDFPHKLTINGLPYTLWVCMGMYRFGLNTRCCLRTVPVIQTQ